MEYVNKLLREHATLLINTFEDYYTFDLKHELVEKVVKEDGITMENIGTNANLSILEKRMLELSPFIPVFEKKGRIPELKSVRFFEIIRYSLAMSTFIKGVLLLSKFKRLIPYDLTVTDVLSVKRPDSVKRHHKSEKTVELYEQLFRFSTTAGDVVLDVFAGSANIAKAPFRLESIASF